MLCITRKLDETVQIGDAFVKVIKIDRGQITLGITAPREVRISRPDDPKAPKPAAVEQPSTK